MPAKPKIVRTVKALRAAVCALARGRRNGRRGARPWGRCMRGI